MAVLPPCEFVGKHSQVGFILPDELPGRSINMPHLIFERRDITAQVGEQDLPDILGARKGR